MQRGNIQKGNQVKRGNNREVKTKADPKQQPKVQQKQKQPKKEEKSKPGHQKLIVEVIEVLSGNSFKFIKNGDKKMEPHIAVIDQILAPKVVYEEKERKEEKFAFESKEFLRSRLIGKKVEITVVNVNDKGIYYVEVKINDTDVAKTIVESGWAYSSRKYKAEYERAKSEGKGMWGKTPAIKEPVGEDKKLFKKEMKIKEFSAVIKDVIGPAHYRIYTKDRKEANIFLYGVDQCLRRSVVDDGEYYEFDEDGAAAMDFIEPMIYQRDVRVTIVDEDKARFAIVTLGKDDLAELLLKNGFVVVRSEAQLEGELLDRYTAAEKEAKKGKKNRWCEFDQEQEDREIKEREEELKKIEQRKDNAPTFNGEIISIGLNSFTVKCKADGSEKVIRFASLKPTRYDHNDKNAMKAYRRAFREVVRKCLVGKKLKLKECYTDIFSDQDGQEMTSVRYDVYIGKNYFGLELVRAKLFSVVEEEDPYRRSFEYDTLLKNKSEDKFVPEQVERIDKNNISRVFASLKNSSFMAQVESVSFNRLFVYIPEKKMEMNVFVDGLYVPKGDDSKEFNDLKKEVQDAVLKEIGLFSVKILFGDDESKNDGKNKKGKNPFNVDITYNQNKDLKKFLIDRFYASPRSEEVSEAVKKARAEKKGIYKFVEERQPKEEKKEEKERPKRKDLPVRQTIDLSGAEKQVVFVGYDGVDVYYYEEKDAKYVEEVEDKLKTVKKENIKDDTKNVIVEIKKRWYRGEIIERNIGANVVVCKDTGMRIVCGKNKLKCSTEEIDKLEIKVQKVGLLGVRPISYHLIDEPIVYKFFSEYQFKPAKITCNKDNKFAKVVIGEDCLNILAVENGLTPVDRSIGRERSDNNDFIKQLKIAEHNAKVGHINIWRFGDLDEEQFEEDKKKDKKPKEEAKKKEKKPKEEAKNSDKK